MDWAKAKSILIVAFIITNLFLGYYVIKDSKANNTVYSISQERINDVKEILKEKNIIVKVDIPQEVFEVPELTVEYETYDSKEMEDKFQVSEHKKSIEYKRKAKTQRSKELTPEEAEKIASDFIKEHGFENDETELWNINEKDQEYEIEYKQKYKNMILNDGFMNVKVKNGEVVQFEKRWLKPVDLSSYEKRVIPATKALLLAIDELKKKKENEESEVVITDIRLVYSLDISEVNEFWSIEWYEIDENTAPDFGFLYWRIRLENKEDIDIEAYE